MFDHFLHREVLVALTHLGEGFVVVVAATLASTDVILREKRAFRAGEAFEHFSHGDTAVDEGFFCRGRHHKGIWTGKAALKFEI